MKKEAKTDDIGLDLIKLAELLNRFDLCNDVEPLNNAGQSMFSQTLPFWSYKLDKLVFRDVNPVSGQIPSDATDISISITIENISGTLSNDLIITNPINQLRFDLEIEAVRLDENCNLDPLYSAWHLDLHIDQPGSNRPAYVHPMYHLTYGGDKMFAKGGVFGSSVILPSPRLIHPPMDAVLGVHFILENFYEYSVTSLLNKETDYKTIVGNARNRIWKPYFSSLYSHWKHSAEWSVDRAFSPSKIFPLW